MERAARAYIYMRINRPGCAIFSFGSHARFAFFSLGVSRLAHATSSVPREEEVALALPVAANIIKGKGVQSEWI